MFVGGLQLDEGEDSSVSFVNSIQVAETARALEAIDRREMRRRYDAMHATEYGYPKSVEDFEYTWDCFGPVRGA